MDAASTAMGIISVIDLIQRVNTACSQMKDAEGVLKWYSDELRGVASIVTVVGRQKDLHTPHIQTEVQKIKSLQEELESGLESYEMRAEASRLKSPKEFARKLFKGSEDDKAFSNTIAKMTSAKTALCIHIQVSSVGIIKDVENNLVAKMKVINEVNAALVKVIGEKGYLPVKMLLEGKTTPGKHNLEYCRIRLLIAISGCDTVVLSTEDAACLNLLIARPEQKVVRVVKKRIVRNNKASGSAFQINAPVGPVDPAADQDEIVVEGNVATDDVFQLNYHNTYESLDYLRAWKEQVERKKKVEARKPQRPDSRRNLPPSPPSSENGGD